ncbi:MULTISPECIES: hypothetical protein [unclassified Polaromonas]|uniref:hypothetical protein n=1 Tax=unclassified Polaromonas TaxID=2638319 RepID=UPI000BD78776|nr:MULTISPECIES: hypothetical protein [unclassified Polaromonas]OYZ75730.1 MAG: hypothetical protein B7Y09_23120 [Polaromonas sp. 24-63-21]OZA46276.1 MAG: hypothetical protein B7X88_23345 [Polaromonas sp. 17-63-33]OZA85257.1 MAG: hypothetical protein B7X65_22375 [Polaromonas sp. 39-63-25]
MKKIEPGTVPTEVAPDSSSGVKNAIVIFIEGQQVSHRFTTQTEGTAYLEGVPETSEAASLMILDSDIPAELLLKTSPVLQERLQEAKRKLTAFLKLKETLDRHGVPKDRALRGAIHKAFRELTASGD